MLLTSFEYFGFLSLAAVLNYLMPGRNRKYLICLLSLFFYGTMAPAYIPAILLVVLISYYDGQFVEKDLGLNRTRAFRIGVLILLGLLAGFKSLALMRPWVLSRFDIQVPGWFKNIALPLGYSFIVFTSLGYLIDVKRGKIKAEKNLAVFAAYLLFFPKLIQGPLERAKSIIPQIRTPKAFDAAGVSAGLKRIAWGLFKKMVVADRLALYTSIIYGNVDRYEGPSFIIAAVFYYFQIYADFSGFMDIAIGSSNILGITLSENFRRPIFADSIGDFWSRWHITFSNWLRDYVFLPTAFKTSRSIKTERFLILKTEYFIYIFATMVTFFVCGLWHGEGLHFVIWGLLFGLLLSFGRLTGIMRRRAIKKIDSVAFRVIYMPLKIFITFILVATLWIIFVVPDLHQAKIILSKIIAFRGAPFLDINTMIYGLVGIGLLMIFEWKEEFYKGRFTLFNNSRPLIRIISYAGLVTLILMLGVIDSGQFIYFKF